MINEKLRRKALKIARRLPKDRGDAEIVVGLLSDLIDWVQPMVSRRAGLDLVRSKNARSSSDFRSNGSDEGSPR